jgi:transposase
MPHGFKVSDGIRAQIFAASGTHHAIAQQFEVSQSLVYNIKHGYNQDKTKLTTAKYVPTRHRTDEELDQESADWLKQRGWL